MASRHSIDLRCATRYGVTLVAFAYDMANSLSSHLSAFKIHVMSRVARPAALVAGVGGGHSDASTYMFCVNLAQGARLCCRWFTGLARLDDSFPQSVSSRPAMCKESSVMGETSKLKIPWRIRKLVSARQKKRPWLCPKIQSIPRWKIHGDKLSIV